MRRQPKAPAAKPLDIPAERPAATGELVEIRDLPEYRRRHGLRIVRVIWRPIDRYPLEFVEEDPGQRKEQP